MQPTKPSVAQDSINSLKTIREASSEVKNWPQWKIANIRLAFSESFGPLAKSNLKERVNKKSEADLDL
jgi:hypothetical protein